MKKVLYVYATLLATALLSSCAKTATTGINDSAKRYFDAWMSIHYPDLKPTGIGTYTIEDHPGTGKAVGSQEDSPFVYLNYTIRDLEGNISSTTYSKVAQMIGKYDETYYYGPEVWGRTGNALSAGLDDIIADMKVGGRRTSIIPGWLVTSQRYDTAQEYIDNVSASNTVIYDLEIVDVFEDVSRWELDSLYRYAKRHYDLEAKDTLKTGFFLKKTGGPQEAVAFKNDTTIHINYIGRLLNGQVFDTNIKDTAIIHGIYSAKKEYEPQSIGWKKDDYTAIVMGSSEIIDGFAYALWKMKDKEKCTAIFYSPLGYSYSGSGSSIPSYSPLRFDIEIVDKE